MLRRVAIIIVIFHDHSDIRIHYNFTRHDACAQHIEHKQNIVEPEAISNSVAPS